MSISVEVDGRELEVPDGSRFLDAINSSGTYISQLCKDPDMNAIGACRTCLVEIEGTRGFPASCSVPRFRRPEGLDRHAQGEDHSPRRPGS